MMSFPRLPKKEEERIIEAEVASIEEEAAYIEEEVASTEEEVDFTVCLK